MYAVFGRIKNAVLIAMFAGAILRIWPAMEAIDKILPLGLPPPLP